jgi:sulfur-carrier protein
MKVRVQLFARARDLAGAEWIELELSNSPTIAELRGAIAGQFPPLAPLLARSVIALNEEFANDADPIPEDSRLAVLPPVSGGE